MIGKVLGSVTQINLYPLDLHIILSATPKLPDEDSIIVFLFGDFIHNFTDGIAIGASFLIGYFKILFLFYKVI